MTTVGCIKPALIGLMHTASVAFEDAHDQPLQPMMNEAHRSRLGRLRRGFTSLGYGMAHFRGGENLEAQSVAE